MKKLACFLLLFMVALLFWLRPKVSEPVEGKLLAPEVPSESMASDARASQRAAPGPSSAHPSSVEIVWLELLLEEHPTPQKIEALAHEQRLPVAQTIQGHPKSGQRLEMRWG
ncbi:MAG: hypothetical protein M3Q07_08325, partial [Pseudobdellovibrionaceae bacterium]|nr:hypothetical protein [Pseudobdellovibrionaceae bacterium]